MRCGAGTEMTGKAEEKLKTRELRMSGRMLRIVLRCQ